MTAAIRTIDAGKHTIRVVRLAWDKEDPPTSVHGRAARRVRGTPPYDVQYNGDKQRRSDVYSAAAKWVSELGAKSIGGPILSGALIAEGIAAKSRRLQSFYIKKKAGLYRTFKHSDDNIRGVCRGNYVVVDDIVSSGDTMEAALKNICRDNGDLEGLEAVLVMSGEFRVNAKSNPLLAGLIKEGKVFGLYCSKRRRS